MLSLINDNHITNIVYFLDPEYYVDLSFNNEATIPAEKKQVNTV